MRYLFLSLLLSIFLFLLSSVNSADEQTGKYFSSGNCKLYYESKGEGIPMVFLHSGACDSSTWNPQFDEFSKYFRSIRMDLRGMGHSCEQREEFSYSADLVKLCDHLKMGRSILIGLSLGSMVAIDFTLENPDKVDVLILVSPWAKGFESSKETDEKIWPAYLAAREGNYKKTVDIIVRYSRFVTENTDPQIEKFIRSNVMDNVKFFTYDFTKIKWASPDAATRLNDIKIPVLIIAGEKDVPDILNSARKIHENVSGSEMISIKDAGHLLNLEKPDEFNRIILDYLKRIGIIK
jgi:pimeloyl-ACP methyl ester carboxylesterase